MKTTCRYKEVNHIIEEIAKSSDFVKNIILSSFFSARKLTSNLKFKKYFYATRYGYTPHVLSWLPWVFHYSLPQRSS
jgi:hypothetical protein